MVTRDQVPAVVVAYLVAMIARFKAEVSRVEQWMVGYGELVLATTDAIGTLAARKYVGKPLDRAGVGARKRRVAQGLADNLIQLAVVGIVILLAILIYSEVDTSLPDPSNSDLSTASSNATSTFADSFELAPLVILVGVASLILVVVRRF